VSPRVVDRRGFTFGSLAAAGFGLAACQTTTREPGQPLTATQAPGRRPALTDADAGLWQIADRTEQEVRRSPHRVRDRALEGYLRDLACRLGGDHCKDIRVYLLRTPHFNASMMPNGCMQVWTGLLLRMENEAQLATVIGHEIGHYLRQHGVERLRSLRNTADALTFLGLGLSVVGLGAVTDLAQLIAIAGLYAYNRDQEREADEMGLDLLAANGLLPTEASIVWQNVVAESNAEEVKRSRDFLLATHPHSEERAATLLDLAQAKAAPPSGWQTGADRLQQVIAPHRRWLLADEVRLFAKAEVFRLRDNEGDSDQALELYQQAAATPNAPPEAYRGIGLIRMKRGDKAGAAEVFRKYLELKPDAEDRLLVGSYIS
jgi:predicted Zn-dependent protease